MPTAPPRACAEPYCTGKVTNPRAHRCPPHQRDYDAAMDQARGSSTRRGYDKRWRRVRAAHLVDHPHCTDCGAKATEVDHVTPLSAGGTHDPWNLRSYCHGCHSRRTGRDQPGGARRGQGVLNTHGPSQIRKPPPGLRAPGS